MACCGTLQGIPLDCERGVGGIIKAWIACRDNINVTIADGEITAISPSDLDTWHEFLFRKQTGSVTTTITTDDAAGTLYYESAIVLQFTKQETSKRLAINALGLSDLAIIIQDSNKRYWYFGYDYGVTLTDGSAETGTALADFNGYNITLTDLSRELPYEVTPEAMESILNPEAIRVGLSSTSLSRETAKTASEGDNTPKAKTKK